MKYRYLFLLMLAFGLASCEPQKKEKEYISLEDRQSLSLMYNESQTKELQTSMTDGDFFTHQKSIEYTLSKGEEGTIVTWDGSSLDISGKVVIFSVDKGTSCKEFKQSLVYKGQGFQGRGTACIVDGKWNLKRSK